MKVEPGFWNGRRVLLTGHTGFKGGWLALWLQRMGARVTGLALPPASTPNLFEVARVGDGMDSRIGDVNSQKLPTSAIKQLCKQTIKFHLYCSFSCPYPINMIFSIQHHVPRSACHLLDILGLCC